MRKTALLASVLVTAALSAVVAPSANAASVDTWERMAQCESSGNWSSNTGNTYYGGLQFSQSTWLAQGGGAYAARADLATKEEQIRIAEKLLRAAGPGQWPKCSREVGLTNDGIDPYPATPPTVRQARTVAADFDGDGRVDVAGIDAYQNLNLYGGNGAGQVSATLPMWGTDGRWSGFKQLAAGDFNGDGRKDIAGIDANDSLKLYTGTGGGYVSGGSVMLGTTGSWAGFKSITAGDFNGDGKQDIAGIDANSTLKLYTGNGAGQLGEAGVMLGGVGAWAGFKDITSGDFNGDNRLDIAGIDANNDLKLYTGNGAGQLGGGSLMLGSGGMWVGFRSVMGGDFNGDGKQDIAGIDANNDLKLYTGNGAGQLAGGSMMIGTSGSGLWSGF